jgi:hypothetical protein
VASGVSAENIALYDGLIDYALVASSITGPGEIIDRDKLDEILSAAATLDEPEHKPKFRAAVEWLDESGQYRKITTTDAEAAETVVGLITGNITLEDLKP